MVGNEEIYSIINIHKKLRIFLTVLVLEYSNIIYLIIIILIINLEMEAY